MPDADVLHNEPLMFTIGGKTYKCGRIDASDRAALREYIRLQRIRVVQQTCHQYVPEVFARTMAITSCQPVSELDLIGYLNTEDGMYYMIWRGIQKFHKEVSLDKLRQELDIALLAMLAQEQYIFSGLMPPEKKPEHDPNQNYQAPDYDLDVALLMRYYGLGFLECQSLSRTQIDAMKAKIPLVAKMLGETKE